jgi:two-component system cell cycle sensor histidine kinase/response regulator CckA
MNRFSFGSLRVRLILLVLIAIIPSLIIILLTGRAERRIAADNATNDAMQLALTASGNHDLLIESTRQLLAGLARLPEMRRQNIQACSALFADLLEQYKRYNNIIAIKPNGDLWCSGVPTGGTPNYSDRGWFLEVMRTRDFVIGEYVVGRVTKKPQSSLAYPILDSKGKVQTIIVTGFGLDWLNQFVDRTKLPPGAVITVIDHNGTVLARTLEPDKWVGQTVKQTPIVNAVLTQQTKGAYETTGIDGIKRLYAFAPLGTQTKGGVYVFIGIATSVAYAQADWILTRNLIALGLASLLAFIVAWVCGNLFLLRRINALLNTAKRLEAGDLSARTGIIYGPGELSTLGHAFDLMAESLEKQIAERKRTEKEVILLADIGRMIGSTLEIEEVYDRVAGEIRKMIPFDSMIVILSCAKQETLNVAYVSGLDIAGRSVGDSYPMQGTVWEEMIRTRRGVIVQSENPEDIVNKFPSLIVSVRAGMRSVMSIPLISRDELIGSLHFRTVKPNSYTDEIFRLAERIGMQIAGAIANAQMVNDLKRAESTLKRKEEESRLLAKENEILAKIGRIISSNINIEEVYERFAEQVGKVISFDRLSVNIINRAEGVVTVAYSVGLTVHGRQPGDVFSLVGSMNELVVAKRSGLLIQPSSEEEIERLLSEQRPAFKAGLRSHLSVPLISEDQVIGILSFFSKRQNAYTDADLRLGEEIGFQIAGAVAGAQIYNYRLRAEEALKKSEERFRELADSLPQVVFEIDLQGVFSYVNSNAFDLFGYTQEDFRKGLNALELVIQEDREVVRKDISRITQGEILGEVEYTAQKKNGETFPVVIHSKRVLRDGNPIGVRGILLDVTDRNRAQEEKRVLEERLQHADKMDAIGTLAGGIAHDFNNLLMGIQGYASLALLGMDSSDPNYERLKRIEEQVQSGADLTKQLLGFARGGRYDVKPADMNDIIEKSSSMFGRTKKEITIHRKFEKDLWTVEVDRGQMDQVFMNLYVNAWQAMPGGGEICLETANILLDDVHAAPYAITQGKYVKIAVTDTGAGMDEKTMARIFDPFFTTKGMGRGTGLGLATVYGIINGHRGMIHVDSEPGHGTTFTLYLPASEKEVVKEKTATGTIAKGTGTILLVDDEKMVLEVSKELLEFLGYRVHMAGSGQEAIAVYMEKRNEIDLVILDMIMPGISGGETFDRLREISPDTKVLLSSGYSLSGEAKTIMDRGCNGFIQKPFQLENLSRKIREIFDRRKLAY